MHKKWALLIAIIGVMVFAALGCSGSSNPVAPVDDETPRMAYGDPLPDGCGDDTVVKLIAGQIYDAGYVTVYNDMDNLYVIFNTTGGWVMTETHVAVADSLEGIPQTKNGSPKIGNFPHKTVHDPAVNYYAYIIDLGDWDVCDELYIATHAVVQELDDNGYVIQEQTGWGEGEGFPKSWAMYFNHEIQSCCSEFLMLPDDSVTAKFYYPWAGISYWKTVLSNVPDGLSVTNGAYPGWCVDQGHYIYPNSTHTVMLYNSYAADLPDYAVDPDWDMVNYVVNHKDPNATIFDIQAAIWYFINGGHYPSDPEAAGMVDDALENGEGFLPSYCDGDLIIVIVDSSTPTMGSRSQLTIIEVECQY